MAQPLEQLFDYVDVDAVADRLRYTVCFQPFIEPLRTNCKHVFCQRCVGRLSPNAPCPACCTPITATDPAELLHDFLDDIPVFCANKARGCAWSGPRGNVADHVRATCDKNVCPLGCPWLGEQRRGRARSLELPADAACVLARMRRYGHSCGTGHASA